MGDNHKACVVRFLPKVVSVAQVQWVKVGDRLLLVRHKMLLLDQRMLLMGHKLGHRRLLVGP